MFCHKLALSHFKGCHLPKLHLSAAYVIKSVFQKSSHYISKNERNDSNYASLGINVKFIIVAFLKVHKCGVHRSHSALFLYRQDAGHPGHYQNTSKLCDVINRE